MPLDPYFASRSALVEGFGSIEEALRDPETASRLAAAFRDDVPEPGPPGDVREEIVGTSAGPVRLRIYTPAPADAAPPAFVWAHGGGFGGGSIDMAESDTVARELAFLHGVLVIAVDYSLSNGTSVVYPVPHTQVADAVAWARDHHAELASDPRRLGVGGASAGANLAVASIWELRARGEVLPDSLVVAYPLLHRKLIMSPELEPELDAALGPMRMSQGIVDTMFNAYTANADAPFASADGNDLAGFPRTLTVVSEYDDLRPSGEAFHAQAQSAGVNATLYLARGMPHGHLDRTRAVPEVRETVRVVADFLNGRSVTVPREAARDRGHTTDLTSG
jgi:acetyl esterase